MISNMFRSTIKTSVLLLIILLPILAGARPRHRKHTVRKVDSTEIRKDRFLLENAITDVADTLVSNIISFSKQFVGTPYRYSGTTPSGFDCSGFVGHLFKDKGVDLPRNSSAMAKVGDAVDKKNLKPGDLVFFKGRGRRSGVGHVGMVVQANDSSVYMIHSSTSRGVVVEDFTKSSYFKNRFIKAKRILPAPTQKN